MVHIKTIVLFGGDEGGRKHCEAMLFLFIRIFVSKISVYYGIKEGINLLIGLCSLVGKCVCIDALSGVIGTPAAALICGFFGNVQHGHDGCVDMAKSMETYMRQIVLC